MPLHRFLGDTMNISGATLLAEYRRAKADWPFIEPVEKAHGLPALLL